MVNVKNVCIKDIKPYDNNPRKNENAVELVARSIKEFGFKVPVVLDQSNVIICGHTRVEAASRLGMDEVPCVIADDLTDAQIKAFRLADNRTHEYAEWDDEKLKTEIDSLMGASFDIAFFGFSEMPADDKEAYDIEDLLKEFEITAAVKHPIWAVIRTEKENEQALENVLRCLPGHIRVERSYG